MLVQPRGGIIAAMIARLLVGSEMSRLSAGMSPRMKSISSGPERAAISRSSAASAASARATSFATIAGSSLSSGSGGPGPRHGPAIVGRRRRDEPAALEHGFERVARSADRIARGLPDRRTRAAGGRGPARRRRTAFLPPRTWAQGRESEHREPEGPHRVGHHLLVPDRDVDVRLSSSRAGSGTAS